MNIYREQNFPALSGREFDTEAKAAMMLRPVLTALSIAINTAAPSVMSDQGSIAIDDLRTAIGKADQWIQQLREAVG